jgi:Kef-type K+ transport system membrane component KefB
METLELLRSHASSLPLLAKFALAMAILVGAPPLSRRVGLPAVVGLLLSGIVIGPHGLRVIGEDHPIASFLSELGKLLLMFFAGAEIDLALFRQVRNRSIIFGLLTTGLPLLLGTVVGLVSAYQPVAAIVLGSLLASHTLLGVPIVARLGVMRLEPITITIGATVLSDTLSLVVFAICVSTYHSGFSVSGIAVQLAEIAVFVPLLLFGLSRLGAYVLAKVKGDEDAYFVLMLVMVAVGGSLAHIIQLPDIVGAFLTGLALNEAVHDTPAKRKLEFFGNAFFIPIFFVVTGFLIDPPVFLRSLRDNFALVSGIIIALVAGKWVAAEIAGRAFAYPPVARKTMWSLTLPQVAATLAAALVAFDTFDPAGHRLVNSTLLNAVLVLMLTTSILGPVLTERFAPRLRALESDGAPGQAPRAAS